MTTAILSVITPIDPPRGDRAYLVQAFTVQADRPLQWIKEHADDLAQHLTTRPYTALYVKG